MKGHFNRDCPQLFGDKFSNHSSQSKFPYNCDSYYNDPICRNFFRLNIGTNIIVYKNEQIKHKLKIGIIKEDKLTECYPRRSECTMHYDFIHTIH